MILPSTGTIGLTSSKMFMYVYALSFRGFETSSQQSLQALEMVYLHIWETGKCRPTSCNVHCLCYFEKWNLWNLTAQSGKIAIISWHNILPFVCMILHAGNVRSGASCPSPPQRRHLRWKDLHPEEPAAKAAGSDVRSCHELQINFQALYLCVRCIQMITNAYKGLQNHIRNCWRELPVKTRPEQRGSVQWWHSQALLEAETAWAIAANRSGSRNMVKAGNQNEPDGFWALVGLFISRWQLHQAQSCGSASSWGFWRYP
jgi:hypothetical protein